MVQERPAYTKFREFINKVIVPNGEEIFSLINKQIAKEVGIVLSESTAHIEGTKQEANANKIIFVRKTNVPFRSLVLNREFQKEAVSVAHFR